MRHSKINKGFTLIELSIVLVIIGLIIGGILTGQELIHGAGVRSTMSQIIKYHSAVNTFQMKYNAIPGDFKSADAYLSYDSYTIQNGNGDGIIGSVAGPSSAKNAGASAASIDAAVGPLEYANFWSHLSTVGLIEGDYTPVTLASDPLSLNANFPAVKMNSAVGVFAYGNSTDNVNYFQLGVTGMAASQASVSTNNFLSPGDAYAIDVKMDDGVPSKGIVAARGGTSGLEIQASASGAPLSITDVSSCVVGGSGYSTSTGYNTVASTSSATCQLRIRIN